jgi:uncharacterized membrane protein YoaK (UPF0700 family)
MLRTEGPERTHRQNQLLAGYLALIAGNVNSAGFVLIGSFTSHVTGNVGRFADDLALNKWGAPFAMLLIVAFFGGGVAASMMLESARPEQRPVVYSRLLFIEASLLAAFALLSYAMDTTDSRFHDVQGVLLCFSMGMQNSFVTRLSGAVIRTTHLTGTMTDLSIETARWFRAWRASLGTKTKLRLVIGDAPLERPSPQRMTLLVTIVGAFFGGSVLGAILAVQAGQLSLLIPTAILFAGGVWSRRADGWRLSLRRSTDGRE